MSYPSGGGSGSGAWSNPPPPGTAVDEQFCRSSRDKAHNASGKSVKETYRSRSRSRSWSRDRSRSRSYSRSRRSGRRSRRSRSSSSSRRHARRRRGRHSPRRRSRSRSPSRRRSYSRQRHRRRRRSYSRSRSRASSRSWSSSPCSDRERRAARPFVPEVPKNQDYIRKVYAKQPAELPAQENTFKNDGSFLELFKKMQEEQKAAEEKKEDVGAEAGGSEVKKPAQPMFGKRRGGRVLKTGLVEKLKSPSEVEEEPKDAWSVYMKEVRRYKEACCDDDSKTRPLVNGKFSEMPAAIKQELSTAPFDPRFPNTNQTRYCYQSYLDFHRCQKLKGKNYEPCNYFKKCFNSMCPHAWVEKWDSQLESGTFAGKI